MSITLPGWICTACQSFNGAAKEWLQLCRVCGEQGPLVFYDKRSAYPQALLKKFRYDKGKHNMSTSTCYLTHIRRAWTLSEATFSLVAESPDDERMQSAALENLRVIRGEIDRAEEILLQKRKEPKQ